VTEQRQPPADLDVREVPVDDPDVAAMMEVRNAVRVEDQASEATWNWLGHQVPWAFDVVARRSGVPVGMASVAPLLYRPDSDAGWAELCVLRKHRRQGIGSELLRRISRAAEAHGKTELRFPVAEDDAYTRAFLARRGYSVVSRDQDSELVLAESDVRAIDPPVGVRITTLAREPDLAERVHGVACEVQPDVPAEERSVVPPFAEWKELELERETTPPEAQFAAVADDGQVLGYALLNVSDVEDGIAYHGMTGTARAARGRGVASAIKRAVILWARDEANLKVLRTTNEERNAPMLAINRKLGYRPKPATLLVRGPTTSA
jgi:GNAT superfamily N-acetyltransferase